MKRKKGIKGSKICEKLGKENFLKNINNGAGNLFFGPVVPGTCLVKAQSPCIIYNLYYIQQLFYPQSLTSGENHPNTCLLKKTGMGAGKLAYIL